MNSTQPFLHTLHVSCVRVPSKEDGCFCEAVRTKDIGHHFEVFEHALHLGAHEERNRCMRFMK